MSQEPIEPSLASAEILYDLEPQERLKTFKAFFKELESYLLHNHKHSQSGLANSAQRARFIDGFLNKLYRLAELQGEPSSIVFVANGGYGRGYLNPGSDLDLLFLLPKPSHRLSPNEKSFIDAILYPLWDLGFKVGHASRSLKECISEAQNDSHTRTTLFDSRLLAGNAEAFEDFQTRFRKEVIEKRRDLFLTDRAADMASRYREYSDTVFLQEPNLKESPGALRDFHNLLWVSDCLFGTRELQDLTERGVLSHEAAEELATGFDFLMRVRNELHYHEGKNADILTLRRQGPVANFFGYPRKTILKRIESLMHDYYRHARRIRQHTETIFEIAELDDKMRPRRRMGLLSAPTPDREFSYFFAQEGRLFAKNDDVFKEDPNRLLSLFLICQEFDLRPSPDLRKLIKTHRHFISNDFLSAKKNRETFQAILQKKGKVGTTLRIMHRVGVLGLFLPEFGLMEFLVQHEFFHRYTADEHTLRCIDQLDNLLESKEPTHDIYRNLLIRHEDPYALYLALVMHDSGRAMGVEEHIDGSAIQTDKVCHRLAIYGERRKLIIFLVDQHLSLFSTATRKDLSDPEVIQDFAAQMKTKHNLDSLLVFTFADANGTNEEAWSGWKESLMLQLYHATRSYLEQGEAEYDAAFRTELIDVKKRVARRLSNSYAPLIEEHFNLMPKRYFRFRGSRSIRHHLRAIRQYRERRERRPDTPFECAVRWLDHPDEGYSELIIAAESKPRLLRCIACALAAHKISVLSADVYTRENTALDLFRVTSEERDAVDDTIRQLSFVTTLYEISGLKDYNPTLYLEQPKNILDKSPITEFTVPTRVLVRNDTDPVYTVVEIQAVDRRGLLHDILTIFDEKELSIIHARICTEKGVALDAFYLLDKDGKNLNTETAKALEEQLDPIL